MEASLNIFTAFALALLDQEDKLSLEDPVRKYLPELPDFKEEVTLRHLLSHTSGYRETYGMAELAGRVPGQDMLVFLNNIPSYLIEN